MPSHNATYNAVLEDGKIVENNCVVIVTIEDYCSAYHYGQVVLPRNATFNDLLHALSPNTVINDWKAAYSIFRDKEKVSDLNEQLEDRGFYTVCIRSTSRMMFNLIVDNKQPLKLLYTTANKTTTVGKALDTTITKNIKHIASFYIDKITTIRNGSTVNVAVTDKIKHASVYNVRARVAKVTCTCDIYINEKYKRTTQVTVDKDTNIKDLHAHLHLDRVRYDRIQIYEKLFDDFADYIPYKEVVDTVADNNKFRVYFIGTVESLHDVS
ncbi:unnamed protein product [Bursaphelenchus okinawaensis]|uniref:Uncharacterized protein n=1 Tax=Bursaphelenchus okinawaensis TaxID=465554 RepID=A0A811K696_9BILA|nr:unnamed protein product [Bursaphelenchus okinawaensis]CAG9092268.1 unnamed protein product [Bursaphelenchus okinawaensis]